MLSSWGERVPEASGHSGSMAGMDHGDSSMMTSKQLDELEGAGVAMVVGLRLVPRGAGGRRSHDVPALPESSRAAAFGHGQ